MTSSTKPGAPAAGEEWTHPLRLSREELEELVVKELVRRKMTVRGPVKFVVGGNPPSLEGAEANVVVEPKETR